MHLSAVIASPDVVAASMSRLLAIAQTANPEVNEFREAMFAIHTPNLGWRNGARPMELVWFEHDDPQWWPITTALNGDVPLGPEAVTPAANRAAVEATVAEALRLVGSVLPELAPMFDQLVAALVLFDASDRVGGSCYSKIGTFWQRADPSRSVVDFAENLVHELIHQLVLLIDLVDPLFDRLGHDFTNEQSFVTSAILGWKRPYDLSFHSAEVALGLVEFYLALGLREEARGRLAQLMICVDELEQGRAMMTPFGQVILDDLVAGSLARWNELVDPAELAGAELDSVLV